MGGVVRAVVGVVETAVGFITGNPYLIIAGINTVGSSLLSKKPATPKASPAQIQRLNANIDTNTGRKSWAGRTAGNTDIRDQEYTDDQTYLQRFIVTAAHRIEAYEEIWLDDKLAWTFAGGTQGEFVGYFSVNTVKEGSAANAINISARMGSTRRYTGCAYVLLGFKLTGNDSTADSPFAQGVPTRITIKGKGALTYDPRLDSTVAGGSGSQRADDQSTWVWSDSASRNPAIVLLWYLLGWRINDLLSVGLGIPPERIDFESFITAANLCDESVSLAAGGTEPRYRCDGVWSETDDPRTVLDALKASMNADLDDVGGKLRLTVFHNDLASPIASFGADNILAAVNWDQTPPLHETFNIVRGTFTDASSNSLYQPVDFPEVALSSIDGIDRIDTFPLLMVQSASQAQRLAKQRLQRQQYGGELKTTFDITGWKVLKNDPIEQTLPVFGWTDKPFRVAEIEQGMDGLVPVVLREEHEDIYAWDEDEAPAVVAADPTLYDRTLNPVFQAITGVPLGQNLLVNPDFTTGLTGWTAWGDGDVGLPVTRGRNDPGHFGQINTVWTKATGTAPAAGKVFDGYGSFGPGPTFLDQLVRWGVPVFPGERVYFGALLAGYRCSVSLLCRFFDGTGGEVAGGGDTTGTPMDGNQFADGDPGEAHLVGRFLDVPTDARYAIVHTRATCPGLSSPTYDNPQFWAGQIFLAKVAPGQVVPPPYSPGPVDRASDATSENTANDTSNVAGVPSDGVIASITALGNAAGRSAEMTLPGSTSPSVMGSVSFTAGPNGTFTLAGGGGYVDAGSGCAVSGYVEYRVGGSGGWTTVPGSSFTGGTSGGGYPNGFSLPSGLSITGSSMSLSGSSQVEFRVVGQKSTSNSLSAVGTAILSVGWS